VRANDLRARFARVTYRMTQGLQGRRGGRLGWEMPLAVAMTFLLLVLFMRAEWPYIRALGDWAFGPTQPRHFANCDAARAANSAPIFRGMPGYRDALDGDGDGVACEPFRGAGSTHGGVVWRGP